MHPPPQCSEFAKLISHCAVFGQPATYFRLPGTKVGKTNKTHMMTPTPKKKDTVHYIFLGKFAFVHAPS